jgi:hypothetical protein
LSGGEPATDGSGVAEPFTAENSPDTETTQAPSSASSPSTASFGNEGGTVTLSCDGSAISLVSATPRQGYTMNVTNAGPEEVAVVFKSSTHDEEIHGHCVGGRPVVSDE